MKKIIFLDRDGVINEDPAEKRYVSRWQDFRFLPGSLNALKKLSDADFEIVVISNQAGITKGLFSWEDLNSVTKNMLKVFQKEGIRLAKIYYCPHRDGDNCFCRKPKTGLFVKAIKDLRIKKFSWQENFFIGDGKFDMEAGKKLNMKTILVLSGKTNREDLSSWIIKPDFIANDLREAVEKFVLNPKSKG